jgi:DNA-binding MarR family transcriptional regulator
MAQPENKFPHKFLKEFLELLADYIPGETTLNQIRIVQYIAFHSQANEGYVGNTEISKALKIPAATVTRAIATFIEAKIITEEIDPKDGRKRLIRMSKDYPRLGILDQEIMEIARRHFMSDKED